jgi:hypothetical protein
MSAVAVSSATGKRSISGAKRGDQVLLFTD